MFEQLIPILNKNPLTTEERLKIEKFESYMFGTRCWGLTPNMISRGLTNGFRDKGPNILRLHKKKE